MLLFFANTVLVTKAVVDIEDMSVNTRNMKIIESLFNDCIKIINCTPNSKRMSTFLSLLGVHVSSYYYHVAIHVTKYRYVEMFY